MLELSRKGREETCHRARETYLDCPVSIYDDTFIRSCKRSHALRLFLTQIGLASVSLKSQTDRWTLATVGEIPVLYMLYFQLVTDEL